VGVQKLVFSRVPDSLLQARPRIILPLGGFQKNNHPISTLAKVILSLSKDDFCGSGAGKPAQIILRQAFGVSSVERSG
jgi:hypothetical protein